MTLAISGVSDTVTAANHDEQQRPSHGDPPSLPGPPTAAPGPRRPPAPHAPMLARRTRVAPAQDAIDRDALRWIARFRFVTADILALHLGVTRQRAGVRVRRLEDEGLVQRRADARQQAWAVAATARGMRSLGLPARRPARTDIQREHELALAWLVTRLEARGDVTVLTERECRQRERVGGIRHSADIVEHGRPRARRWPDLVVERADGFRLALEFERTLKGTTRLAGIVSAYRGADWFDEVRFLCADPAIASAVGAKVAAGSPSHIPGLAARKPAISLAPWPGLTPAGKVAVQDAIDRANPLATPQAAQP